MSNVRILRPAVLNGSVSNYIESRSNGSYVVVVEFKSGQSGFVADPNLIESLCATLKWDGNGNCIPTEDISEFINNALRIGSKNVSIDYFDEYFGMPTDESGYAS